MHNELCVSYLSEYSVLRLIHNNYDNIDDNTFVQDLNRSLELIRKICNENRDKISQTHFNLLKKIDNILASTFNTGNKTNRNLSKRIIIELIKRQLNMLLSIICEPCINSLEDRAKCKIYIRRFQNLNFVKEKETYDFRNKDKFINDLTAITQLISTIYGDNDVFASSRNLENINNEIFEYLRNNNDSNEENKIEIRKTVRELMVNQLYTIIIMLCNFCKIIKDLEFGDAGRRPFHEQLPGINPCTQSVKYAQQSKYIIEKLISGQTLDADDQKYFFCVLTGNITNKNVELEFRHELSSLIKIYVDWLIYKIESGSSFTPGQRSDIAMIFLKNNAVKNLFQEIAFKNFAKKKRLPQSITHFNQLSLADLMEYEAKYYYRVYDDIYLKSIIRIKTEETTRKAEEVRKAENKIKTERKNTEVVAKAKAIKDAEEMAKTKANTDSIL